MGNERWPADVADRGQERPDAGGEGTRGRRLRGPRHELSPGDAGFPQALLAIPRPPERLYVIGEVEALAEGIAIIGARKATGYGLGCAHRFARIAAQQGVTVVSGGALGCDSEAHRGALEGGGTTVAILGGGCDCLYPLRNEGLFQRIIDAGGAVVSERAWSVPPLPFMFRERNRLIAGLAKATLVVEAGLPSGTFSTADEALAAGRDVLAVPGSIVSETSAGANRLVVQGAHPVVDDDTFESALFMLFGALRAEGEKQRKRLPDDPLLKALMASPMRPDEMLAGGFPVDAATLMLNLAQYEGTGFIERYPDGRYGPSKSWMEA